MATVTPDPSTPRDIHLSNDVQIILKFWCNQQIQFTVQPQLHRILSLISQYLLPFFSDSRKRNSDDAGKSIMLISIMAEMVLIGQMPENWIDAGQ